MKLGQRGDDYRKGNIIKINNQTAAAKVRSLNDQSIREPVRRLDLSLNDKSRIDGCIRVQIIALRRKAPTDCTKVKNFSRVDGAQLTFDCPKPEFNSVIVPKRNAPSPTYALARSITVSGVSNGKSAACRAFGGLTSRCPRCRWHSPANWFNPMAVHKICPLLKVLPRLRRFTRMSFDQAVEIRLADF
jgi:hypothetical protein